jgi:hypothetical protein
MTPTPDRPTTAELIEEFQEEVDAWNYCAVVIGALDGLEGRRLARRAAALAADLRELVALRAVMRAGNDDSAVESSREGRALFECRFPRSDACIAAMAGFAADLRSQLAALTAERDALEAKLRGTVSVIKRRNDLQRAKEAPNG